MTNHHDDLFPKPQMTTRHDQTSPTKHPRTKTNSDTAVAHRDRLELRTGPGARPRMTHAPASREIHYRLHHVGLGRHHAGKTVLILVHDLHVRIITTSGQLLRDFELNPDRDCQPQPQT